MDNYSMYKQSVLEYFRGADSSQAPVKAAAKYFGVKSQSVSQWRGLIPEKQAMRAGLDPSFPLLYESGLYEVGI